MRALQGLQLRAWVRITWDFELILEVLVGFGKLRWSGGFGAGEMCGTVLDPDVCASCLGLGIFQPNSSSGFCSFFYSAEWSTPQTLPLRPLFPPTH